jgi:parvulin-like peptidyl-prolyl isomerase
MKQTGFRCCVLLLLVAGAAPQLFAQGATSNIIQRVLVKVNGEFFTQKELEEKQIEKLQDDGKGALQGEALAKAVTDIMPDLLVTAVDEMLLLQRGKELAFRMSEEQFGELVENIKKDNQMNEEQLKAALAQENLTLENLRARLDRNFIIRQVQQREILGRMTVTEEELRQYYGKHPEEFVKPATVMLRELLVAVPAETGRGGQPQLFGGSAQNTDARAREKIDALRERAAKGEDFEKLIAEGSDSPTKAAGGVIGPIIVTEMATGIRDAIDKMQAGEITQPIRTTRGYQIFKLESRTKEEPQAFDDVRDAIAQKVGESRLDVETNKYLKTLREQAIVEWKRADLQQMYEKRLAERTKQ